MSETHTPDPACLHEWRTIAFDFMTATIKYRCSRCRTEKREKTGPMKPKERERSRGRRGRRAA